MKRLLLLFTAFLGMIGLVGCDLISPEVVEEVSEQYCRDNPTADICQGESVGDLEENEVLVVFNTLLDEYNDTDNTTFCEDYFSVTNIELLDECRDARSELFPEDLSEWTVERATRQSTLSTQTVYDVLVTSPNGLTTYTFEVGLIMVDGYMYVDYWEYTEETIDPSTLAIETSDAIALFQQFLSDHSDSGIDSTTFCATYDPTGELTDCVSGRDSDIADNLVYTYTSLTLDGELYHGEATYTSDSVDGTAVIMVDIYYDESAVLTLELVSILHEQIYNEADYLEFISSLFQDFFDSTRSPEDICNDYFVTDQYEFCMEGYAQKEAEGYTQEITEFDSFEDHHIITIDTLMDGTIQSTMTIEVYFIETDDGLRVRLDPDSGSETNEFTEFITALIADYQDSSITSATICDTYFLTDDPSECIAERDEFIAKGMTITLLDIFFDEDIEAWYFEAEFNEGTTVETETQKVLFTYDDNNDLKIEWEDNGMNDPYQEYYDFLVDFIEAYQDDTIDSTIICNTYLATEDLTMCAEDREDFLKEGMTATLVEFYPVENDMWEFKLEMSDGTNSETIHQKVQFIYDDNNDLRIVMDATQDDEYMTYKGFIEQFFTNYADPNKDSTDVCNNYFEMGATDDCINDRDQFINQSGTASLIELYRNEFGMWEFQAEIYDGTSTEQITQTVEFIWNTNGELRLRFVELDPNMDVYKQLVQDMITNFQDSSVTTVDVCNTYFITEDIDGCAEERDTNYDFSYSITLEGFWPHGDGRFGIELRYHNGTEEYREKMIVEFYDDNGTWKLSLEPDPMMFFENYIYLFVSDMQDSSISNEEFCQNYFDSEFASDCIQERSNYLNGYEIVIQQFYPVMDGSIWYLELEYSSTDESFLQVHYLLFYEDENGEIKLQFIIDQNGYDDAAEVLQSFINQYNDPNITSSDLCNQFFTGDEVTACIDKRDNLDPDYLVAIEDMQPMADGRFKVYFYYYKENTTDPMDYIEELIVSVDQDELDNWKLSFEEGQDPNQDLDQHVNNFVMAFNDTDVPLDTVCNIYFGPESVQACIDMFGMYRNNTMTLLDFYPVDKGDYMLHLELNDGTNIVDVSFTVNFYYDEFGTLWMIPARDNSNIDFDAAQAFLDQFVVSFNDTTLSNTDFATFLDTNSQWLVPDFRQIALENGRSITYFWLYQIDGNYQFEFELSDGSRHLFDVLFHSYNGVLVVEMWYPAPPVSEDEAWSWINSVFDAIDSGVDTDTICNTYFGPLSQPRCYEEINHWRENNELVVPTRLSGYDKWDLTLTFTYPDQHTEEHSWGLAFFWDENGVLMGEFLSVLDPGDPITWNDAEGFIGTVVQALNNGDQIPTICMNMFDAKSYDQCYGAMEYILTSGKTIQIVYVHDMIDYWEFEFELVDMNGEAEYFTIYARLFYYAEGDIRAELMTPGDGINEPLKQELLHDFLTDFNDGTIPSTTLCQTYFSADSITACEELFQYVDGNNTGNTLDYWFVDFEYQPNYIEFAIRENGMTAISFVSVDVEFDVLSDGTLQFSFTNAFYYTYGDETLAETTIHDMISDFNDTTITTDSFCDMWRSLFDTCDSIRNDALNNNETMVLVGLYNTEHHSFTARLELQSSAETRLYDLFIEFHLVIDRDGYLNVWGWTERLDTPMYDDMTVQTAFETFMVEFFDNTITDEEFSLLYDYVWIPGIGYREDMIERGISVTVIDTYMIYINGDYQEYEAEVLVTEGLDQTTYYIRFSIMEDWDNNLIPAIFYEDVFPPDADYEQFITTFLSDIQDQSLSDDELCDTYFGPWEDWLCGAIRSVIIDEGQTLTLVETNFEEWDNTFTVELSNGEYLTLGVDYNVDLFGHRYMTVYYYIPMELWDQADTAFNDMITRWETTEISLPDLCQEIDCSGILEETKQIESIVVNEHHLHPDDLMQHQFYAEIMMYFLDGTYQYVELMTSVDIDANGAYVFTYTVIGEELPIPFDETQLYDQDVVNVLNLFIDDLLDETILAQSLCDTYFGTQMRRLDCVEGRQMYIDNNYAITLLPLVDGVDEFGNSVDIAFFQFDDGTETFEMSTGVRIYDYGDGTYYIWFVDNTTVVPAS